MLAVSLLGTSACASSTTSVVGYRVTREISAHVEQTCLAQQSLLVDLKLGRPTSKVLALLQTPTGEPLNCVTHRPGDCLTGCETQLRMPLLNHARTAIREDGRVTDCAPSKATAGEPIQPGPHRVVFYAFTESGTPHGGPITKFDWPYTPRCPDPSR